jgi:hypothetical protein
MAILAHFFQEKLSMGDTGLFLLLGQELKCTPQKNPLLLV